MVLGVNPTSYIIYRMTGIRPLGRPRLPNYVFKSIEDSSDKIKQYLGDSVSYRVSYRGVYFRGTIFPSASKEIEDIYQQKMGFPVPMEVGSYQTVSIEIEESGWYTKGEVDRIERREGGGFLVYLVGSPKPIETEWIWSTLPMRVTLKLLDLPTGGLKRIFIYRFRSSKVFDKDVNHIFDPEYELIYDADPDSEFARHLRIGIPGSKNLTWYSEIWSLTPMNNVEGAVKFYTIPYPSRKRTLPKGLEVIGAYAEWDYSKGINSVIEKVEKLSKSYGVTLK
jgi:hypothetical protein